MIEPTASPERRALPVSPQLALRVAMLGGLAFVLFAIIFFRLWYLQVLSGDQYRQQANTNRVRDLPIPAPRGEILDRNGLRLATDRVTNAVQIVPAQLPTGAARHQLYSRLARVLGLTEARVYQLVHRGALALPYANVTIKVDTGYPILTYLSEHQQDFPGVTSQQITIRDYPHNDLAAQVLGYVSQIGTTQVGKRSFRGVKPGTIVGQDGLESQYDSYLRGTPGVNRVQVNSQGQYAGTQKPSLPVAGHDVRLTLDLGLEQEADRALQQGMGLARGLGNPAPYGAYVAMDPRNGQVLAVGSSPSFDPNIFARPLTDAQYKALIGTSKQAGPLFNRAISGQYPTGSTFKPITALAGLRSGLITPGTTMGAGSCLVIAAEKFCNAGGASDGALDLQNALRVSEDTYFYQLGAEANGLSGEVIQTMARRLGLNQPTGIDLPNEEPGNVPDKAWRARQDAKEFACRRRLHKASCGIADGNPWTVGDNVQLATGQGDLLATPLQMATMYSTLANTFANGTGHGIVPVPHLASEVDDSSGGLMQLINPPAARHVYINPSDLSVVMAGLHDAATAPGGTSSDVWKGFPRMVYGKTGTAQHTNQADQSWYVTYLPDAARPIVIAVTVEQGGFGDQAAAPVARLIASKWFNLPPKLVAGSNTSR